MHWSEVQGAGSNWNILKEHTLKDLDFTTFICFMLKHFITLAFQLMCKEKQITKNQF